MRAIQPEKYQRRTRFFGSLFLIGNFLFDARIVKEIYEFMDKFSVKGGCRVEVFRRTVN